MLKVHTNRMNNEKGFTLIELLAVLVILAVIAAIAIPLIGGIINSSKNNADVATARQIYEAARLYNVGENLTDAKTSVEIGDLIAKNYLDSGLKLPSDSTGIVAGTVNLNGTEPVVSIKTKEGTTLTTFSQSEIQSGKRNKTSN